MDEILIAYATKHGSTHEVAEAVAARLAAAGVEAHTLAANRVRSLDEYRAVVLGARDSSRAEVLHGLNDGDVVVKAGHQKLYEGAHVMPLSSASMGAPGAPAAAGGKGSAS